MEEMWYTEEMTKTEENKWAHPCHPVTQPYLTPAPVSINFVYASHSNHEFFKGGSYFGSGMATAAGTPAYTPSGSPFLGPLKGMNLHSANPLRAPSPILMPQV
ncbi:hypothetical protein BDP27DRAFT_1422941 [Rhodocollybia butyracea]|uniref:Uncharacterized protein n=1 Tax=Rhodocollybia butyracea TaxID=206335 RepID=A0A9P5U637_9AGAR|nr:hypothetical protein BDP27DRAFT_1422941 [Rhodocollybia butyracea]